MRLNMLDARLDDDGCAAAMARQFNAGGGVADSELSGILPNIGHFGGTGYPVNLGFML